MPVHENRRDAKLSNNWSWAAVRALEAGLSVNEILKIEGPALYKAYPPTSRTSGEGRASRGVKPKAKHAQKSAQMQPQGLPTALPGLSAALRNLAPYLVGVNVVSVNITVNEGNGPPTISYSIGRRQTVFEEGTLKAEEEAALRQ